MGSLQIDFNTKWNHLGTKNHNLTNSMVRRKLNKGTRGNKSERNFIL